MLAQVTSCAVLGLDDLEIHLFQDSPGYFSDDA